MFRYAKIISFRNAWDFFSCFLKCFCDKFGVHGSRFGRFFGSSTNGPKNIGICPGTLVNHFGIIKTQTYYKIPLKTKTNQNKCLFLLACRARQYETTALGGPAHPDPSGLMWGALVPPTCRPPTPHPTPSCMKEYGPKRGLIGPYGQHFK